MGSSAPSFSAPPEEVTFRGLLFDMDGTIIDSTEAVIKHWHDIGNELGVDPNVILQTSHGRRSIDVLKLLSPEKANWEYVKYMEGRVPEKYGADAVEIPGARSLLSTLTNKNIPWAIVTSGTTPLVSGWLRIMKIPTPEHLVVAENVEHGKPDPQGYLMGLKKLGLEKEAKQENGEVLVLEDSPAGIRAGKAAGCKVVGLVTTHTAEQVLEAGADWVLRDLRSIKVVNSGVHGVTLEIQDAWVKG